MKPSRFAAMLALLALIAGACSERAGSPADVGGAASLSFAPRFASFGGVQSTAPINFIRLTAYNVATNAIVATLDTTVNPADAEWEINLQVPPDVGSVRVLVELINKVGAIETIEWSGMTAPIDVQPGSSTPAQVTLFKGPPANINVTQVSASPDALTLPEGTAGRFNATALPAGVVFWSSLNPLVATVDANGNVTTLRNGTARIVAEAGPRADTVTVNVTQVVTAIVATPDSVLLTSIGADTHVGAVARDIRGGDVAGAGISWTIVSGNSVLQDLGNGHFRALANGRAEVRASSTANPTIGDNAVINVVQRGASLEVTPASVALNTIGATRQFTAAVEDANGHPMSAAIAWRTANAAVATIDANGLATARGAGATDVIAVLNAGSPDSVTARAGISVALEIRSIVMAPAGATLEAIGATAQFTAEAFDAAGNRVNSAVITWSVSGAAASVNETGLVTAISNGNATLIAAAAGARATAAIIVRQRATAVALTPTLDSIAAGEAIALSAVVTDSRGGLIQSPAITWTSSNPLAATVDANGVVTGLATGSTMITATVDGVSATATVVVTGTAGTQNLTAISIATTPINPLVEGQPVVVSVAIRNNGTAPSPATTIRLSILDAVPPHVQLRDSSFVLPSIPALTTVNIPQSVTLTSFAGLPDSVKIRVTIDPQNLVTETNEDDNSATTGTKFLAFGEFVWTGAVSNAWENPANWSTGAVPHAESNVRILAGTPNNPVLNAYTEIAQLTQAAGTSLTLAGNIVFEVHGSLIGVNIIGGTVNLTAPPVAGAVVDRYATPPVAVTVSGTVFNLYVQHPVELADDFRATGTTHITASGAVYVSAYLFRVDGSLHVAGILNMTEADARVVVGETTVFAGTTSLVDHLTAGELHVLGSFFANAANAFPATGTHLTVFANANPAQATLSNGAGVHFRNLRIEKPNTFTFTTPVIVEGSVVVAAITAEVVNTNNITIGGDLQLLGSTFWHVQSTTFTGDPIFPAEMIYGVTFTGNANLRQDTEIGGLAVTGNGKLDLDGFDLTVGGTFHVTDNATIEMQNGETLDIGANATFDGGSTAGKLTHGRINFRGDFTAARALAFAASAVDDGPSLTSWFMGTDPQVLNMAQAHPTTGNRFGHLHIANPDGVTLFDNVVVMGTLEMDEVAPLVGDDYSLRIFGDIIDNASCGCESSLLPSTVAGVATVALTPEQSALAQTQMNYHVASTILSGTHQRLPDLIDTSITVNSNLKLDGIIFVTGSFQIIGNLRLGGDTGFDCPATYLLVQGDFYTTGSGTLEMLCSHDAFLTLDVDGGMYFAGGSETGRLKNGRIEVGGNFETGGSSPTSFVSEGTALWLAPDAAGPVQQITLSDPAQQTLRDVIIRRFGQTGDIDIDIVNGAHVFGHFSVDSAGGAFVNLKSTNNATLYVRGIDTCDDLCWYGSFQLYHARIDNLPVVTEHVEIYVQYLTFGTFATNVTQLRIVDVQHSPYFDAITFETVPAEGFYHIHASDDSEDIVVNNPIPATEAAGARWLAETGAHISWGHEPNLILDGIGVPNLVTIGQSLTINGLVLNEGVNPAGPFNIRVRIVNANTGMPVPNVPTLNIAVPGAPGGVLVPISQPVTIVAAPGIVWPPTIKAEILLDSGNTVAETNERDNLWLTTTVGVIAPPPNVVDARVPSPAPPRR